jgi:predicted MFS family arabinose efflux permease
MTAKREKNQYTFPSLALSVATGGPPAIALGLLMLDISHTLNTPIALLGQLSTFSSFLSIIMAILMGILAMKYRYKTLLSIGLLIIAASTVVCSIAPNYLTILVSYSFQGVGYSIILSMATTMIGVQFPPEERIKAMGRLIAGRSVSSIFATPIIGLIVGLSNWRWGFIGFSLPLMILSLILVYVGLPSDYGETGGDTSTVLVGIKQVLKDRSAVASLIAASLAMTLFSAVQVFNGSYLRQRFDLSVQTVSILLPLIAISVTIGTLTTSQIVRRLSLRKVVYFTTFFAALSYLIYFTQQDYRIAIVFSSIGACLTGMRVTVAGSLSLEQVPLYRGSMMSLNTAATSLGGVLGAGIGGYALLSNGYTGLGFALFFMSVLSTVLYTKVRF